MKTETYDVKSESKVVGTASVKVYDTLAEATSDLGEPKVLELFNVQNKTTEMNKIRQAASGKVTKTWLRDQAMNELLSEGGFQAAGIIGNPTAIHDLIEKRMGEIETRMKANTPVVEGGNEE